MPVVVDGSRPLDELLRLHPGRPVELTGPVGLGATRLGYRMLAGPSATAPVAAVDVRGWMSPLAAWEVGVERDRLVVIRCADVGLWSQVVSALMDGMGAVFAEVPERAKDRELVRLAARARARGARVVFRPLGRPLPRGVAYLRLRLVGVRWDGTDRGHGRLARRLLMLEASGRGVGGMTRNLEVEDVGADTMRLVPDVAVGGGADG